MGRGGPDRDSDCDSYSQPPTVSGRALGGDGVFASGDEEDRRRLRFEQLLLLATRCLVLLGLGLALSRPLGCADNSMASLAGGRRTGLHVFVIDNSLSMAYQADRPGARTHLDQAKIIAKTLIGRLSSGGESVAIVTAARPAAR